LQFKFILIMRVGPLGSIIGPREFRVMPSESKNIKRLKNSTYPTLLLGVYWQPTTWSISHCHSYTFFKIFNVKMCKTKHIIQ